MPKTTDELEAELLEANRRLAEKDRQLSMMPMDRRPENALQTIARWWRDQRARSQIVER